MDKDIIITVSDIFCEIDQEKTIKLKVVVKNNFEKPLETVLLKEEFNQFVKWDFEEAEIIIGRLEGMEEREVIIPLKLVNIPEAIINPVNVREDNNKYFLEYVDLKPPITFFIRCEYTYKKDEQLILGFDYSESVFIGYNSCSLSKFLFSQVVKLPDEGRKIEAIESINTSANVEEYKKSERSFGSKGKAKIKGNVCLEIVYRLVERENPVKLIYNVSFQKGFFVPKNLREGIEGISIELEDIDFQWVVENLYTLEGKLMIIAKGIDR